MNSVRSFRTYMWSKSDALGSGVTSNVYRAVCQNTNKYVAIKVFNEKAKERSNAIQLRELELLRRIDHPNVVKLIDFYEQNSSLSLIIMEYCNGGCLTTLIEEPEHAYGLQQTEFLLVLKHITSGMSELHRLQIVHRDIKPMNILLQILPNGEHVYKLSDFGTAREIAAEDGGQFWSICGTEEYVHPEVYEKAFINRNIQRTFRPKIDLWSIGVSLYQAATGMLPFRPVGGTRDNRNIMIFITKYKPSGCISGFQKSNRTGEIQYSSRLPDTCQLSKNLQGLIIPMLAGLMEINYECMWTFEKFFRHSSFITSLEFINLMNLDKCEIIEFPIEKTAKLNDLKERIRKDTNIEKNSQLIIYNNLLLDSLVTENQNIETYPLMDKQHPCILFSLETILNCENLEIISRPIPDEKTRGRPITALDILDWSRQTCGLIYYMKREIDQINMVIESLKLSAIAFKSYMPEVKLKVNQSLSIDFKSHVKRVETKLCLIDKLEEGLTKSYNRTYEAIKQDIKKYQDDIFTYEKEINSLTLKINEIGNLDFLAQNSTQTSRWKSMAHAYTRAAQNVHDEFMERKREHRDEHDKFEFERSLFTKFKIDQMISIRDEVINLYQQEIVVNFVDFYSRFEKWMSDLIQLHNDVMSVQKTLGDYERDMGEPLAIKESLLDERIRVLKEFIEYQSRTQPTNHQQSVVYQQRGPTITSSPCNRGGDNLNLAMNVDTPPASSATNSRTSSMNSETNASVAASSRQILRHSSNNNELISRNSQFENVFIQSGQIQVHTIKK